MSKDQDLSLAASTENPIFLDDPRTTVERLRRGSDQIIHRLRMLSASVGPASQLSQFYTRSRSKTAQSINGKILKQQRENSHGNPRYFSFRDITDYAGYRIVTLYDEELFDSLAFVVNLVSAGMRIDQPIFAPGKLHSSNCFREASFISRSDDDNDIYKKLREDFRRLVSPEFDDQDEEAFSDFLTKKVKLRTRNPNSNISPYSSAHLLFYGIAYIDNIAIHVPIEFQLRTVAEDFWSEINHKSLYKISDDYVWTIYFANEVTKATALSFDLKSRLDSIPELVQQFSRHTAAAENAVTGIFSLIGTDSEAIHSSLITALFFFTGDFDFPTEHRSDISVVFHEFMINYGRFIRDLKGDLGHEDAIQNLKEGISLLFKMIEDNERYKEQIEIREIENRENVVELFNQRDILLKLEIVRLQVIALTEHEVHIEGVLLQDADIKIVHQIPESDAQLKDFLKRVYISLCSFVDNGHLKARPICMIYYWKYLVALRSNTYLANRNISIAYSELSSDGTVAEWSIYRVIVPRALSTSIYQEVYITLSTFSPEDILDDTMLGLRTEIQEKLNNALIYSLEAYHEHHKGLERRGDLRLGFSPEEDIIDAYQISKIVLLFYNYFGKYLAEGRGKLDLEARAAIDFFVKLSVDEGFAKLLEKPTLLDEVTRMSAEFRGKKGSIFET